MQAYFCRIMPDIQGTQLKASSENKLIYSGGKRCQEKRRRHFRQERTARQGEGKNEEQEETKQRTGKGYKDMKKKNRTKGNCCGGRMCGWLCVFPKIEPPPPGALGRLGSFPFRRPGQVPCKKEVERRGGGLS